MHINLVLFLVILFDIKDYTYTQKETETPASLSQAQVASPLQRLDETLLFADCLDPPSIECTSLQGQAFIAQTQSRDGGNCDYALALPLVQEAQQVLCDEVRIVLSELGEMHRYSLCPWAKAERSGFTEGVFTEEVATAKRVGSVGDSGGVLPLRRPSRPHHRGSAPRPRRRRRSRRETMERQRWILRGNLQRRHPCPRRHRSHRRGRSKL